MGNSNDTMHIGYRILSVDENGPMSQISLEPATDFIIHPDDPLYPRSFEETITCSQGKPIELSVYNLLTKSIRKITVTPSFAKGKGYLGITARPEDYSTAHIRIIHVLNYLSYSPLEKAGIIQNKDYILCGAEETFADLDDFEEYVKQNVRNEVELFVYNADTESVRKVKVVPRKSFGGIGHLGGDFGFGLLHEIPIKVRRSQVLLQSENVANNISAESLPKADQIIDKADASISAETKHVKNGSPKASAELSAALKAMEKAAELHMVKDGRNENDPVKNELKADDIDKRDLN